MRKLLCTPLTPVIFILMVLLLGVAFPVPSFAASDIISITSSTSSGSGHNIRGSITHYIRGGCLFKSYEFEADFSGYLGNLQDGTHFCGYRWVNGSLNYWNGGNDSVAYSTHSITNGAFSDTTNNTYGGTSILDMWSGADSDIKKNTHNILSSITINLEDYINGSGSNVLVTPFSRSGSSIFAYKFDMDSGIVGTTVELSRAGIDLKYSDGVDFSDSNEAAYIESLINPSINFYCGLAQPNLLPDDFSDIWNNWDNSRSCLIYGSIPLKTDSYLTASSFTFYPASTDFYNWKLASTGQKLPSTGNYYNFLTYSQPYSDGISVSELYSSNPVFMFKACDSDDECASWSQFRDMYLNNKIEASKQPNMSSPSSESVFMQWFNVFGFGFSFPFLRLFNAFSSNNCVEIPTIAGMLSLPSNTQYCTWWSSDLRAILTPVFNILILSLVTGFIYSFLKGHSDSLNPDRSVNFNKKGSKS